MTARQGQGQGGKSVCGSGFRTAQCPVHGCRGVGHENPSGLAQASTEGAAGSCQVRLVRAALRSLTPRVFSSLSSDKWLGCAMHQEHFVLKPKLKPDSRIS